MPEPAPLVNQGVAVLAEPLLLVPIGPNAHAGWLVALGANHLHVRDVDRTRLLQDAALGLLGRLAEVALDQAQALHGHALGLAVDLQHLAALGRRGLLRALGAGDDLDGVSNLELLHGSSPSSRTA